VKACYVNLMGGGDQISARVSPDDKGRFRIAELPAGQWTVMVSGADGLATLYQGQVALGPGETKELTIDAKKE
jgi:nitrogen fixation protein FixH